jgi:hypothetical protein
VLPGERIGVDRDGSKDAMRFERLSSARAEKQPAAAAGI